MSPKQNGTVTPIKFNAGGNKKRLTQSNNNNDSNNTADPSTHNQSVSSVNSGSMKWIQTGLQKKQTPLNIKHWIATVLTLDGRDKFTKVLQYSCRLLGWYFAGLATRSSSSAAGSSSIAGGGSSGGDGGMPPQQFYQALSTRFTSLYKSLVTSRKAFRMGRSVVEWDKIRSMGWGDYLGYLLCHPLEEGGANDAIKDVEEDCGGVGEGNRHSLGRYDTHPILEEDEELDDDDDNSWNGDEKSAAVEEKKDDASTTHQPLSEKNKKVVSRPERPILPSRISSNIGWGPSNTTAAIEEDTSSSPSLPHHPPPPPRTVSEMGRQMYRPYPSQSSTSFGSYQQLKGTTTASTSTLSKQQTPPTPAWKLIGGTLKLVGLMGFWAFDNLSFLTSSGFLDPITSDSKSNATIRTKRKQRASEYAARCYFMGGLAGLYVNLRSFWIHRNGALVKARRRYHHHHDESTTTTTSSSNSSHDKESDDSSANDALKKVEQKHFELFLALLKSTCDVTVFSNNPGIDLHLKLRGKKNHEGFHCLCGLISASTVLYNNFPNAE